MLKKCLSVLIAAAMICSMFCITTVFAQDGDKSISWMCVGDSITYGNKVPGGYRAPLYNLYKQNGIALRMVGPNNANNGTVLPENSGHAGYGGYYITEISNKIISWVESYRPQVVSLQLGTNDMLMNKTDKFPNDKRDGAPDRLAALIDKIAATSPNTEIFVAKIPPLNSSYNKYVTAYNASIESMVAEKGSKVHLVDNYTALSDDLSANLQSDGIHPTQTGYDKMAQSWYDGSQSVVSAIEPTTPDVLKATSRTGKYLLHLSSTGTESYKNTSSANLTLTENTDYDVSFYIKGDVGTKIMARVVSSDWSKIIKNAFFETGPNWSECTFTFNSSTCTSVKLAFMDNSAVAGNVYVDDCSFVKSGSDENILLNPGFENLASNWTLTSVFEIAKSIDVLTPPESVAVGDRTVAKTVSITMDEFNSKDLPTDISCASFGTGYYTNPTQVTSDFVTEKSGMFYKDSNGKGYLMLNPKDSSQTTKLWLDKAGYSDITGFDELRIKFKVMQRENTDYTNYPITKQKIMKFAFGDVVVGGSATPVAKATDVYIQPSKWSTLDDECEEVVIKRTDFAGGTLDMEGSLKPYTEGDKSHVFQIALTGTTRYVWLIDEFNFVWYDNPATAEITEIGFTNNGENINADGLKAGVTEMSVNLYNPTEANLDNAQIILALYNRQTKQLTDVDSQQFSLEGKGRTDGLTLSVEVPDDNIDNYEIRVYTFGGFNSLKPLLKSFRFDANGEVK